MTAKVCEISPHHGYSESGVCSWCKPLPALPPVVVVDEPPRCCDAIACIGGCVLAVGHEGAPNSGHQLDDGRRYGWCGISGAVLVWLPDATAPRGEP